MSSPCISSTSVKKGTCVAAKELPVRAAAPVEALGSVKIGCLLLVLTVMTVALYLITMPSPRRQDRAVVTLIDVDDEGVSRDRGSVRLRTALRNLLPTKSQRPASTKRIATTTEATEAESSSDTGMAASVTGLMDAPQIIYQNESRGPCTEQAEFGACTRENRHEFFFDIEKQQCRSKARQLPPSCLAGRNRFKSFRDCRLACMDQKNGATLSLSTRGALPDDIVRQWWYLKGGRCHLWKFPNSNCVSPRLALFEREEDCHNLCVAGNPVARHPSCSETPVQHVCTALHMVYPVLARPHQKRLTCVQTDDSEPKCLTGSNRFHSEEACRKTCLET
ncbi:hypothetical protein HPB50_024612 [Hyalomma asiaticum]|uniref:Uncharacterized protein n=1 Tax=Hyalomma asiaticum TaxID=266040 RepID=A0ACB7T1N6_HYAAI|nr:hypothetical protein HPB50_024612 [Hyalomma asiaticum]